MISSERKQELIERFTRDAERAAERNARRSDQQLDVEDCGLSVAADQANQSLARAKAELVENDFLHEFPALVDLDGKPVNAKAVNTRFGLKWLVMDDEGNAIGWHSIPYTDRQKANLEKKGYREAMVKRTAWVTLDGQLGSWFVRYFPTDEPWIAAEREKS